MHVQTIEPKTDLYIYIENVYATTDPYDGGTCSRCYVLSWKVKDRPVSHFSSLVKITLDLRGFVCRMHTQCILQRILFRRQRSRVRMGTRSRSSVVIWAFQARCRSSAVIVAGSNVVNFCLAALSWGRISPKQLAWKETGGNNISSFSRSTKARLRIYTCVAACCT